MFCKAWSAYFQLTFYSQGLHPKCADLYPWKILEIHLLFPQHYVCQKHCPASKPLFQNCQMPLEGKTVPVWQEEVGRGWWEVSPVNLVPLKFFIFCQAFCALRQFFKNNVLCDFCSSAGRWVQIIQFTICYSIFSKVEFECAK